MIIYIQAVSFLVVHTRIFPYTYARNAIHTRVRTYSNIHQVHTHAYTLNKCLFNKHARTHKIHLKNTRYHHSSNTHTLSSFIKYKHTYHHSSNTHLKYWSKSHSLTHTQGQILRCTCPLHWKRIID